MSASINFQTHYMLPSSLDFMVIIKTFIIGKDSFVMMCDSDDDTYHRFAEASDSLSDISSVSDEEVFKLFNAADSEEENSEGIYPF